MNKAETIKLKLKKTSLEKYSKKQAIDLVTKAYDDGEPIFIIRGKDQLSWKTVKAYAEMLKNAALGEHFQQGQATISYDLAEAAERYAAFMIEWQGLNMELIKLPD